MKLRVARHTDNLNRIKSFYLKILGFSELGHFEGHEGYDGVFIGKRESDWHFEFTQSIEKALHQPEEDNIVVLYPETKREYDALLKRLSEYHVQLIFSKNPYWNKNGIMFKDPDGFPMIISPLKIQP